MAERKTAKPASRRIWTREETLLAFNLYCSMPFGQIHHDNPRIMRLAGILDRTPSSVSMKMCNLAGYDPKHTERGVKGLSRPCKIEHLVWTEFNESPGDVLYESEMLLARLKVSRINPEMALETEIAALPEGMEKKTMIKARVNQTLFRRDVLFAYGGKCCMTGIDDVELLNASHIVPWSENPRERLNPRNGLCLNALHDRAFDRGLVSVKPDCTVRVARRILQAASRSKKIEFIAESDGVQIQLPKKFPPKPKFLEHHYRNIFVDKK